MAITNGIDVGANSLSSISGGNAAATGGIKDVVLNSSNTAYNKLTTTTDVINTKDIADVGNTSHPDSLVAGLLAYIQQRQAKVAAASLQNQVTQTQSPITATNSTTTTSTPQTRTAKSSAINSTSSASSASSVSSVRTVSDAQITSLYNNLLNRAPDAAGFKYWQDAANKGATLSDMTLCFLKDSEYTSSHQGKVTGNDIESLYATLLGRPSDSAGKSFWVQQANNGATILEIASDIANSSEYIELHSNDHQSLVNAIS